MARIHFDIFVWILLHSETIRNSCKKALSTKHKFLKHFPLNGWLWRQQKCLYTQRIKPAKTLYMLDGKWFYLWAIIWSTHSHQAKSVPYQHHKVNAGSEKWFDSITNWMKYNKKNTQFFWTIAGWEIKKNRSGWDWLKEMTISKQKSHQFALSKWH